MLSHPLGPVQLQPHISIEEAAQCLAYSCLSYYAGGVLEPRVVTSFERAWGHNTIIHFPITTPLLGTPIVGAIAMIWNDGLFKRVMIAVQGTTDVGQQFRAAVSESLVPPFALDTMTGRQGAIYRQWNRQANGIWAQILLNPILMAAINTERTVLTFTGHSMGAAVAEVLASNFKQANPHRRVRLCKFASPRIGTRQWYPFIGSSVPTLSVLCGRDPIHFVPAAGLRMSVSFEPLSSILPMTFWQSLKRDEVVYRMRRDSPQWTIGYRDDGLFNEVGAAAWAITAMEPGNPWFDHLISSYRLGMMNFAASANDSLRLRFNYLEMPDENVWQTTFVPGASDWRTWNVVNPIQPDAAIVPSGIVVTEDDANDPANNPAPQEPLSDPAIGGMRDGRPWLLEAPIPPVAPPPARRIRPLL